MMSGEQALRRIGFIFSTEVGLQTQYQNWRNEVEGLLPERAAEWIVIQWFHQNGWIERLPLLPGGLKTRLRSQLELHHGLRRGPFGGLLIGAPGVIYGNQSALRRQPYFISIDCTPRQLQQFGSLYAKNASVFTLLERVKEHERRQFYRGARALFPWSRWAGESMVGDYHADPERLHIVPPGVDLAQWAMPERTPSETCHLLFVGGDFVRKGGDLLLEWARRTGKKNWQLHVVTREQVRPNHPNVQVYNGLKANSPELIALYQKADLFVLPTRGDCYSIAGIEAMAAGIPILLGDTGGTSEVVTEGVTGYLLPQDAPDVLADRLDTLIERPELRRTLGRAARADAEARYDVHRNVRTTLCLMERYLEVS